MQKNSARCHLVVGGEITKQRKRKNIGVVRICHAEHATACCTDF